jgi:broad specificity phosphatase PhoE
MQFHQTPSLLVTSPFLRTHQTAQPALERFPGIRHETWPVHEFTYLSPASCTGTTAAQRRDRVAAYWGRNDPEHVDGEGAESFAAMLVRVRWMLERLRGESGFVAVFTHGQIMRATQLLLESPHAPAGQVMRQFHALPPVRNAEIMPITLWA